MIGFYPYSDGVPIMPVVESGKGVEIIRPLTDTELYERQRLLTELQESVNSQWKVVGITVHNTIDIEGSTTNFIPILVDRREII